MAEAIVGSYNPETGERNESTFAYTPVQPPNPGLMTPDRANAMLQYAARTNPKAVPELYRRLEATMEYQRRVAAGESNIISKNPTVASGLFGAGAPAAMRLDTAKPAPELKFNPIPGMTNSQVATYGNTMRVINNMLKTPGEVTSKTIGGIQGVQIVNPNGTTTWKPLTPPTQTVVEKTEITPAEPAKPGFLGFGKTEAVPESQKVVGRLVTKKVPIESPATKTASSNIPEEHIAYLKAHPEKAASFDKQYGAGSAALFLNR